MCYITKKSDKYQEGGIKNTMQNKSKTRFLSALLASAMAFSQVSPTIALALSPDAPTTQNDVEMPTENIEEKTDAAQDASVPADSPANEGLTDVAAPPEIEESPELPDAAVKKM